MFVSVTVRRPSMFNSTWRSVRFGSDTISLSPLLDTNVCNKCTYYIAVYGSSESVYTLSVTEKDTVVDLSPGVHIASRVNFMEWDWYSFMFNSQNPHAFTLTLTPTTGNPDLYVSLG